MQTGLADQAHVMFLRVVLQDNTVSGLEQTGGHILRGLQAWHYPPKAGNLRRAAACKCRISHADGSNTMTFHPDGSSMIRPEGRLHHASSIQFCRKPAPRNEIATINACYGEAMVC